MVAARGGEPTPVIEPSVEALAGMPASDGTVRALPTAPSRVPRHTLEDRLFEEPYAFDFFQAVLILERLGKDRMPVGRFSAPKAEVVRFRSHLSLSFPPSALSELERMPGENPLPFMTVTFLGLTGPSGVLPRHYTELLLRLEREEKGPEKRALREWLDLFNHRLLSFFYRAWEKYRFSIPYAREEYARAEADPFTRSLFSLVGLGIPSLRNRLRVAVFEEDKEIAQERALARIEDLALLHYAGLLAHQPRSACMLEALLRDYFALPLQVQQFRGQWLRPDPANQTRMGDEGGNNQLGVSAVAGERVWDVQSKVRVRLGPLRYPQFAEFIPDRSPIAERKAFYLLSHLVRLYVGMELDFDVQLVLKAEDVPACQLADGGIGPRLGWNTWVCSGPLTQDAEDAVFSGEELVLVNRVETVC